MPSGKSIFDVIGSEPVRISAPPLQMQAPAAAPKAKPNWAGILADALAGAMGKPGMYAASCSSSAPQSKRTRSGPAASSPSLASTSRRSRSTSATQTRRTCRRSSEMRGPGPQWVPDLQAAYRAAQAARPQFIPDGMGGGQWAAPPMQGGMPRPVGKLTPIDGGPTPQASANFPR